MGTEQGDVGCRAKLSHARCTSNDDTAASKFDPALHSCFYSVAYMSLHHQPCPNELDSSHTPTHKLHASTARPTHAIACVFIHAACNTHAPT